MTTTTTPQLALTRIFDAPRALVYQAFTDPDQFAAWWGPIGNSLPRDEIVFDVRPGGHQRWSEVFPAEPGVERFEQVVTATGRKTLEFQALVNAERARPMRVKSLRHARRVRAGRVLFHRVNDVRPKRTPHLVNWALPRRLGMVQQRAPL